jgi:hypothetical protein
MQEQVSEKILLRITFFISFEFESAQAKSPDQGLKNLKPTFFFWKSSAIVGLMSHASFSAA